MKSLLKITEGEDNIFHLVIQENCSDLFYGIVEMLDKAKVERGLLYSALNKENSR